MGLFTVLHATMPYCVKKQDDGSWVFLNREYKPIGFFTRDHIDYSDYPIGIEIPGLTPSVAKKIAYSGGPAGNEIFLYNDSCVPTHSAENMSDYLKRLKTLASLKLDPNKAHKRPTKPRGSETQ